MRGLTRKPLWVRLLGWFLCLLVLGMPLQAMLFFGHPPTELRAIWAKIAPQNQLVMACSALAAVGVQRVARWGWAAALAVVAVSLWNNWILLHFPGPVPPWAVVGASVGLACLGLWLLRPSAYRLFHARGLHWWRAAPRHRVSAPAELTRAEGSRVEGRVFNLSRTGLFLEADPRAVEPGEVVDVRLRLADRVLACRARVVRRSSANGAYPDGLGLRFATVPLLDRLRLRFASFPGGSLVPCPSAPSRRRP